MKLEQNKLAKRKLYHRGAQRRTTEHAEIKYELLLGLKDLTARIAKKAKDAKRT